MYAVVKTGGKQYKVAPGEKLKVEQIPADVGAEVILDQVLMVGDGESVRLGQPDRRRRDGQGHRRRAWPRRKGQDLQDAPPQALSKAPGASAELHRAPDRQHRRLRSIEPWHTRKQAAVRVTAAIPNRSGWASRSTAAKSIRAGGIIVRQRGTRDPSRRQRRSRQGPHAVRARRRQGVVPRQGRAPAQVRERRAGHGSRIAHVRSASPGPRRARGFFCR